MRKFLSAIVTLILLSVFGAPAFAGTEAFNSYKHTNEYGTRETTINIQQDNYTHSVIDSQSIKMEADLGDVNIVNISFDGDQFTGTAHSSNQRPVDPVVYGTYTSERTVSTSSEWVDVNTVESVTFDSSDYTHTVGSGSY